MRTALVLPLVLWVTACSPGPGPTSLYTFEGPTMGTTFSVKVVTSGLTESRIATLRTSIERTLASVDQRMSTYRPESELNQFNNLQTTEPFDVSADTLAVFRYALEISELTDGAFDVTIGPMVDAWGFGPPGRPEVFPTAPDIERLRAHVGYRQLQVDVIGSTIRKLDPMLACDLSALAKGYAVDRVADLLSAEGLDAYLVEVGGEVRTRGYSERGDPWRVGIERPSSGPPSVQRLVSLRDLALATSGDYRNYYEVEGRRVSHTIDPRTGRPVAHGLASVSVIETLCVRADAIATALEVLGPDEGFALAIEQGWAALLIGRHDDGTLYERETPAFAALSAAA